MIKKNGGIFGRSPTYNDVTVEGVLTLKEDQVFDNDITINGDLIVNGTETVINTVELNVDDKNITMGAVVAKVGLAATTNITAGQFTVQLADTSGLIPGMTVTKTAGTGAFGASPKIASVDSHTQITLTVAHATSGTIIFDTGGATDDTADGGGITLKGTADKFIKWVKANLAWVFSDPIKAPDVTVDNLTASKLVATDANKKLVSQDSTGTGNVVRADTPTVTSPTFETGSTHNYLVASKVVATDADKKLINLDSTGTGNVVRATSPTFETDTTHNYLAASKVVATDANKKLTNLNSTGTGNVVLATSPTLVTPTIGVASTTAISLDATGSIPANGGIVRNANGYTYVTGKSNGNGIIISNGDGTATIRAMSPGGTNGYVLIETGNGAEAARFNDTGNLAFVSGKGIDFSATPGTGTSELFADYEEGTWTPALSGDSGSSGVTYTTQIGRYTKIGNIVHLYFKVQPSGGTLTGGVVGLTNLPFTSNNDVQPTGVVEFTSLLSNWVFLGLKANSSFSYFRGRTAASTGTAYIAPASIDMVNTVLEGWVSYRT